MAAYVLAQADVTPEKSALEVLHPDRADIWTYRALSNAVMATAGGLQSLGLNKGDLILLRIGNHVDFPVLYLAAIAAGFVPVPTSSQLTDHEVRALIAELGPKLVVFGAAITPFETRCAQIGPHEIAALRRHAPGAVDWGDPDRLAYIVMTSGTSGKPRAVQHAHRAVWARRMMWDGWYGLTDSDRLLHAGAFNWTYTLGTGLMDPWAIGATALIPDPTAARAEFPELLKKYHASIFAAAPGVYRQMLRSESQFVLPDFRHGLSAGEKLPAAVHSAWRDRTGTEIFEALGMSEVSTFISSAPGSPCPVGTSGRVQAGRRVAVLDPLDGTPVAVNRPGILAVSRRDPGLMLGYRHAPDATAEKFRGEWFLTGDMVKMDAAGHVTYLGRNDDMMNAGGYRVSPLEVEAVLNDFDGIQDTAAVSVEIKPDTFIIAAFYQSDAEYAQADLTAFCAARLARYKCPRLFQRVDALPKGANNKLKRGALREMFGKTDD